MPDTKNKILYLYSNCQKNEQYRLQDILEMEGYKVLCEDSKNFPEIEKINKLVNEKSPNIVIYRITEKCKLIKGIKEYFENLYIEKKIPVLFLSSFATTNKYLDAFSNGMSNHINLPCSSKYLIKKIANLLGEISEDKEFEKVNNIPLFYNDKLHKIDIKNKDLNAFMLSALENSIGQRKILSKYIQKNHKSNLLVQETVATPEDDKHDELKKLQIDLEAAFNKKEYKLYYQPVHEISTNKLIGFEALIRWIHPEKGIIPPDQFISAIENSYLIFPVGFWIIDEACHQIKLWNDKYKTNSPLRVNINLSPKQFHHIGLIDYIFEAMKRLELDFQSVGFEITESAFMEDTDVANTMLLRLKSKKINLYMDDFGTGYSSLSYLMHFPVDILKIDKSFVKWMHVDEQSEEIVRAVIALAHNLKMKVVSEGIETEEHLNMLKDFKSEYGQGYLYSKPLCVKEAEEYIEKFIS